MSKNIEIKSILSVFANSGVAFIWIIIAWIWRNYIESTVTSEIWAMNKNIQYNYILHISIEITIDYKLLCCCHSPTNWQLILPNCFPVIVLTRKDQTASSIVIPPQPLIFLCLLISFLIDPTGAVSSKFITIDPVVFLGVTARFTLRALITASDTVIFVGRET